MANSTPGRWCIYPAPSSDRVSLRGWVIEFMGHPRRDGRTGGVVQLSHVPRGPHTDLLSVGPIGGYAGCSGTHHTRYAGCSPTSASCVYGHALGSPVGRSPADGDDHGNRILASFRGSPKRNSELSCVFCHCSLDGPGILLVR